MSIQGLQWSKLEFPLAAGLGQKFDDRARPAPFLDICKDVQFDEAGGLQTRYPFASLSANILGGGTISNARRLVENGNELLLFTDVALYSWSAQSSKWVHKGEHLATKVEESTRFATTADQVECDRAELNGTICFTWADPSGPYLAAIDKTTGAVVLGPTRIFGGLTRPRLVATTTKIMLFVVTGDPEMYAYALDPADPAAGLATPLLVLAAPNFGLYYDVARVPGTDTVVGACRRTTTTSYTAFKVTAALALTTSTKARTCDGPIAVAVSPDASAVQIVRANSTNIQGDLLTVSALADVSTASAIGTATTPVNQIAACFRSVAEASTDYRCHVFWSGDESTDGQDTFLSKTNYIDQPTGTIGTQATFVRRLGVASRAFDHNGRVYIWAVFAGASSTVTAGTLFGSFGSQLQNTYFLYRDDAFLVAKAATSRAGGFATSTGYLPGVALTNSTALTYSWCGVERNIIPLGVRSSGYGARNPRDISVTFDSNEARRARRLGNTLYITGGEILQYDGTRLAEVGFHVYPWYFAGAEIATGNLVAGTYAYKITLRWDNAMGDIDRSTTATHGDVAIITAPGGVQLQVIPPLFVSHKFDNQPAIEVWRTAKDPTADSPFYLVTDKDPAVITGDNRYLTNNTSTDPISNFDDVLVDADATQRESNPENFGVLESLAPPPATIIAATSERIFLAGIAGDPDRVWYSKVRADGEVAAFNDFLTVPVPSGGGVITALAFLNETLIVFKETAIYALDGVGYDNNSLGQNYGPARLLSGDVGAVSQEAIGTTDKGVIFKSSKGWFLLNRGWSVEYIGAQVCDYDSDTVVAVHVVEAQHQIRCLTTSRMLVFDDIAGQWSEWSIADGVHAAIWNSTYLYLTTTGPKQQGTAYTALTYGWDVETSWIKVNELQGIARVRKILALGEYLSAHHVRIRLAFNYDAAYVDDMYWTPSPTTVGGPEQVKVGPSRQQCQSIKIRLTAVSATDHAAPPTGAAAKLTGLALEVGAKPGTYNRLPVGQKAST